MKTPQVEMRSSSAASVLPFSTEPALHGRAVQASSAQSLLATWLNGMKTHASTCVLSFSYDFLCHPSGQEATRLGLRGLRISETTLAVCTVLLQEPAIC